MITIEDVFTTIDSNNNLNDGFKSNLKELVTIFNKFFPSLSLENLNSRLKTVSVSKSNKLVNKKIFDYNVLSNVIYFNLDSINEGYDIKHALMHILLRMITAKNNNFGFDKDNKFITFNIGYTEILANFLVGNENETVLYEDEIIATNLIAEVIGNDVLFEAYFTNKPELIADVLANEEIFGK